jgi:hypothetical protein
VRVAISVIFRAPACSTVTLDLETERTANAQNAYMLFHPSNVRIVGNLMSLAHGFGVHGRAPTNRDAGESAIGVRVCFSQRGCLHERAGELDLENSPQRSIRATRGKPGA